MFSFNKEKIDWKTEIVGEGTFGKVYHYKTTNKQNERFVVKHIIASDPTACLNNMQEVVLGFSCKHPHVLPVRGYFFDYDKTKRTWDIYVKLERMESSLKDKIERHRKYQTMIPEEEIAKYFYHLTCGLEYLHNQGIAHRDIKPDNILINREDNLLIADVGVAKFVGDETSVSLKDIAGTAHYMAPEIYSRMFEGRADRMKKKKLFKADLWSLGVVMAELCIGPTLNSQNDIFLKQKTDLPKLTRSLEVFRGQYSGFLIELILSLVRHNPNDRLSLNDVRTKLEKNYPNLLIVQRREKQNNLDTFIEELSQLNQQSMSSDLISQLKQLKEEEIKLINQTRQYGKTIGKYLLKKFMENWNGMFKIETDFEKRLKIYKKHVRKAFEIENPDSIITDDVLKDLSEQLVQVQKISFNYQLEHLAMDLSNCNEITDEGVKELTKNIALNFGGVKQLKLYFSGCKKITNSAVEELAQQIAYLQGLEQLNLLFTNCNQITDSGVQALAQNIGNYLQYLQELHLGFQACTNITDDGLKELINSIIPNLKKLQYLNIDLRMVNKITDKEIESIREATKSLKSFELELS